MCVMIRNIVVRHSHIVDVKWTLKQEYCKFLLLCNSYLSQSQPLVKESEVQGVVNGPVSQINNLQRRGYIYGAVKGHRDFMFTAAVQSLDGVNQSINQSTQNL